VNYNILPWEATKKGNILLSLLIPGKHKVANMDVYLEPLIDELLELWKGVAVLDVSKSQPHRHAIIKGILMWTMHDYPGLGEVSGVYFQDLKAYYFPYYNCMCVFSLKHISFY
jgi:hypothetical protein